MLPYLKTIFLKIFLSKSNNFKVKIAQSEKELDLVFRLRYLIYKEKNYIDIKKFPDRKFRDKFDDFSINFLVFFKKKPIGTARVVLPSKLGFPIQEYYNIHIDTKNTVEMSRLAILPKYRGKGRTAVLLLIQNLYIWSISNQIHLWYMFMPEKLTRSFERFGVSFQRIPEKELTLHNLQAREGIKGYFEHTKAKPYELDVRELDAIAQSFKLNPTNSL